MTRSDETLRRLAEQQRDAPFAREVLKLLDRLAAEPHSDAVTASDEPSTEWGRKPWPTLTDEHGFVREARAASASVPPPLSSEIRSVAAAMLRGEHTCDRRHKSEHVHFDDVHRWGQRLAFALNAAETPEQGR